MRIITPSKRPIIGIATILTQDEIARKVEDAKRYEAEDKKRKAEARERAMAIWHGAKPAPDAHPYLIRKGIKAHGLRLHKDLLVVPMRDGAGELHSLQFIGAEGEKRFLTGGRVAACHYLIGKPDGLVCVVEGYATGASVHEATGYAVAVAFNVGNLEPVARTLKGKLPDARLILCADDDYQTEGNPGLTGALEAARRTQSLETSNRLYHIFPQMGNII